jgi:hypothetical protein
MKIASEQTNQLQLFKNTFINSQYCMNRLSNTEIFTVLNNSFAGKRTDDNIFKRLLKIVTLSEVVLGGLTFSVLAIGPGFAGSNLAMSDNSPHLAFLRRGSKPVGPCRKVLRYVKGTFEV